MTHIVTLFIAYQIPLFRFGLRSVLERSGMQVVGESVEPEQILDLVSTLQPHVVLISAGLSSPTYTTVEVVTELWRESRCGIMVFDPAPSEERLFRFLMAGAAAYESCTLTTPDLVERVQQVAEGHYLISSTVLHATFAQCTAKSVPAEPTQEGREDSEQETSAGISDREITVLKYLMQGYSNKQIARYLQISDQTVKNHVTSINRKLHAPDRTAAVVQALRSGLLSLKDKPDHLQGERTRPEKTSQIVPKKAVGSRAHPYARASHA